MSDPIAVSILSKLTSYYPLDGNLTDVHGPNNVVNGVVAAYESGKLGNMLSVGSKGSATLAAPIPFTRVTGSLTIGGWVYYQGSVANHAHFGLTGAAWEGFFMSSGANFLKAFGWLNAGTNDYLVGTAEGAGLAYPITVQAQDVVGTEATSAQIIIIGGNLGALPEGWYFTTATWENGNMKMYVDSLLKATATPPASVVNSSLTMFMIGSTLNGNLTVAGLDEIFFCDSDVMTQAEIDWMYNAGAGRTYAQIVAAAA